MKKIMNNILAACLLSSLIACSLDDPYMPVNPEEKPAPPVVTEYQPVALTIGANGSFEVSGSSVKIGLNGKNNHSYLSSSYYPKHYLFRPDGPIPVRSTHRILYTHSPKYNY